MNPSHDPGASARRIASRAVLLALPLVAVAVGVPPILRYLRPDASRQAALAGALQQDVAGAAVPAAEAPPPPKPEGPTTEQIEAARKAQVALGKAQEGWESVTVISPRKGRVGEDGLETLPFQGFGLSVDSAPEGASVVVGDEPLGETPLLASVKCTPGSDVKVRVEKAPLAPQERTVRCRADTLVKLAVTLEAAGGR